MAKKLLKGDAILKWEQENSGPIHTALEKGIPNKKASANASLSFERELKLDLETRANFSRLEKRLRRLPSLGMKQQLNIFFDSPERILQKNKMALRLRQENEKFFLTAKGSNSHSSDLAIRPEIECEIIALEGLSLLHQEINLAGLEYPPLIWIQEQISRTLPGLSVQKRSFRDLSFWEILRFSNQRQCFQLKQNGLSLVLELDHTDYGNQVHAFELEVEFSSEGDYVAAKPLLEEILQDERLPWKISSQSKFARALKLSEAS